MNERKTLFFLNDDVKLVNNDNNNNNSMPFCKTKEFSSLANGMERIKPIRFVKLS